MRSRGGLIGAEDLAAAEHPTEPEPLRMPFAGAELLTMPPPGGGIELAQALLELGSASAEEHWQGACADAVRLAFTLREQRAWGPEEWLRETGGALPARGEPSGPAVHTGAEEAGETTHVCAADEAGNVVSLTQSIQSLYGAKAAHPELGFLYNNYLLTCPRRPHGHRLAPRAFARSNAAPTLVLDHDGRPRLALGAAGSRRIVSALVQVLGAVLARGERLEDAVAAPRVHARLDGIAWVERDGLTEPVASELERRGFAITPRRRAASRWARYRRSSVGAPGRSSESRTDGGTVSRVVSEPATRPEAGAGLKPAPSRRDLAVLLGLWVGAPLVLLALKHTGLPVGSFLRRHDSLARLPQGLHGVVANILLVPLGALVVVSFRLTLGLRVLGPFRSILLAFAFLSTGILVGLAFFAATVAILIFSRPLVRTLRLPYFGRVSVMLSLVAVLLVLATLTGTWLSSAALRGVAHFPIVVLCLIGEAVAKAIRTEGAVVGLWRASMTALGAVLVTAVASIGGLRELLLRDPELMLIETAAIAFVARFCAWRLLQSVNPGARKQPARRPMAVSG